MDDEEFAPLPPRREKHGSKYNDLDSAMAALNVDQPPRSMRQIQELNSRFARRKAMKEFTLNPQGYREKAPKPKKEKRERSEGKKIKKKWSSGLLTANVILGLFLLMIGIMFFFIFYKY